eukprot:SAG11_NODE_20888_length_436_cov_0.925816_1_plen_41_part_10
MVAGARVECFEEDMPGRLAREAALSLDRFGLRLLLLRLFLF